MRNLHGLQSEGLNRFRLSLHQSICGPPKHQRGVGGLIALCIVSFGFNLLPLQAQTTSQGSTTAYYRLRVELKTTSDWTNLVFPDSSSVLSVRQIATTGELSGVTSAVDRISLTQTLANASAGQSIGVTVDLAFAAEKTSIGLPISIQKGALNNTTVKVSLLLGAEMRPLGQFQHTGYVGPYPNAVDFDVDTSTLTGAPPTQARLRIPSQQLLWALYYQWYDLSSWSNPILKDRPATLYTSADPKAISRQISQAQSAGIDGFVCSWLGPDSATDGNFRTLLSLAKDRGLRVALYFETSQLVNYGNYPDNKEASFNWLSYAISNYRNSPALFKVDGKPLILVYASGMLPTSSWADIFARLRAQGLDAVFVAFGLNLADLEVFDGLHDLGVFDISNLEETERSVSRSVHNYPLLSDSPSTKIWIGTAEPGFDDRLTPWTNNRFVDRENGATYRRLFEAAIQSDPDWILIDNWNEYWENAYIEPSQLYQDQYLKLTQQLAAEWKVPSSSGACAPSVTPIQLSALDSTGYFTVGIQTSSTCAWTVENLPDWVTVLGSAQGTGSSTVTFVVAPNSGHGRLAAVTVAGVSVSIAQQGITCSYALSPADQSFPAAGGAGSVKVSAPSGCAWSVTNALPWVKLTSSASGAGSGVMNFDVAANTGASRSGTFSIAGHEFTVEQVGSTAFSSSALFPHFAAGGGWNTRLMLINTGSVPVTCRLSFWSDTGTLVELALNLPQSTGTAQLIASTIERDLAVGATLVIETASVEPVQQTGWIQVQSSGTVAGYDNFRLATSSGFREVFLPLQAPKASSLLLPFDHTGGYGTGIAIADMSSLGGMVGVVIRDDSGTQIGTDTLHFQPQGHTQLDLATTYKATSGIRGTIEIEGTGSAGIGALGIRYSTNGEIAAVVPVAR